MTCQPHREAELEREEVRRELEGLPDIVEVPDLAPIPATVENSPYPPPPPAVDEAGNLTVSPFLRGCR